MSYPFGDGSARRRRLGVLLRRVRKDAGLSGEALAGRLGVSQSHLSRVELGQTAATPDLVARWAQVTAASPDDRVTLAELAEAVAVEVTTWTTIAAAMTSDPALTTMFQKLAALTSGLAKLQYDVAEAEAAATTISAWVPLLVPGLLQTPGYTHHLVSGDYPDRVDVGEAVAARIQRQTVLYERGKTLRWVIGEGGLRWQVGPPEVMAAQLDRLALLAAEPHLDLRILPFSATRALWHDHGFTMLADRVDDQPDLVHVELLTGVQNVSDPELVTTYRQAYDRLADLAVGGSDAVALVRAIMAEQGR